MITDGGTAQGSVNVVRRIGETIRRPSGPWTPVVRSLLEHLADVGFTAAPRFLGIDSEGREILSLLRGEVALRPWPAVLRGEDGIRSIATWLRDYHAAVAGFTPPADAVWRVPGQTWTAGQIVRHGDLGPWNSVWRGADLVGFIDWDFAEPGSTWDDLAQLALYLAPLRGDEHARAAGLAEPTDPRGRLESLCDAYGCEPVAVLNAVEALQRREADRIATLGAQGLEPWNSFARRGDLEKMTAELAWLADNKRQLVRDNAKLA
ncbi:phosphotransferase [Longispora fulva]|uniref:Aminoglycoside phosphotransferase domain-containing protein n=1 Tax=Longispora fulva TaxID=619741 RepID=A0A8J7KPJ2_9ACTN|nr:phosphotransferase [Longispora fulva]MBG6136362.1 hypothetical protein [Longispora fulva]